MFRTRSEFKVCTFERELLNFIANFGFIVGLTFDQWHLTYLRYLSKSHGGTYFGNRLLSRLTVYSVQGVATSPLYRAVCIVPLVNFAVSQSYPADASCFNLRDSDLHSAEGQSCNLNRCVPFLTFPSCLRLFRRCKGTVSFDLRSICIPSVMRPKAVVA